MQTIYTIAIEASLYCECITFSKLITTCYDFLKMIFLATMATALYLADSFYKDSTLSF